MTKVSPTWRVAVSAAAAALPSTTHHRLSPAVISTIVGTWWPSVHQRCPSACTQRVETQTSKSSVDDIATHLTHYHHAGELSFLCRNYHSFVFPRCCGSVADRAVCSVHQQCLYTLLPPLSSMELFGHVKCAPPAQPRPARRQFSFLQCPSEENSNSSPGARPPAGRCKRQGITNQDETQLLRFVRIWKYSFNQESRLCYELGCIYLPQWHALLLME